MEVGVEQTIRLKFGDTVIELSHKDADKLYDNLADALGYEKRKDKIVYVPYDTTPYIPPRRICDPYYPYWKWDPYTVTISSGYSQIMDGTLSIGDTVTKSDGTQFSHTTTATTEKG